ncbi:iron-sulfur cluster repair di-iron protein [Flavobacterium sp. 316]|uniref:Iron-sulfur cluster repair di-iron protein n=1 Tax=Flavobacterium sediminilitoris TaxID=2024526 RepID=A0ABY4HLC9_9FLAO|nr:MULTISPECIES: iron-sulfur cluster repair di-iron protein [Flavobacterium]KIX20333.1 iron-sulfur cluster repair di-iron protein [Flavobacterium sp. 316]UOX33483.1 iron-sulfur cluster repair di-iron protein [Flavobacterium sediminilitoris]
MNILEKQTIGEYVANDFRTASVFSKYGIDFCCKGNRTIEEACSKKGLDAELIQKEIDKIVKSKNSNHTDFQSWPIDFLIDYIKKNHHRYIEEKTPTLLAYLDKLCKVHGSAHPELLLINELFKSSAGELAQHMKKEELILFPFIEKMSNAIRGNFSLEPPHFGKVENPIAMMKDEHENEGDRFVRISELTNNYTPPTDACNTYKVTFLMLQEFEQDLHKHIHLENNILFIKAIEMEKKLFAS